MAIEIVELAEYARITHYCVICGGKVDWTPLKGKTYDDSPTLDRIENTADMTMENTQIVCHLCNSTKRNRTMEEFVKFCKKVVETYKIT